MLGRANELELFLGAGVVVGSVEPHELVRVARVRFRVLLFSRAVCPLGVTSDGEFSGVLGDCIQRFSPRVFSELVAAGVFSEAEAAFEGDQLALLETTSSLGRFSNPAL